MTTKSEIETVIRGLRTAVISGATSFEDARDLVLARFPEAANHFFISLALMSRKTALQRDAGDNEVGLSAIAAMAAAEAADLGD